MTIDELILNLETLKEVHGGEVDVTMWQYAGGNEDLYNVLPVFDPEIQRVVLEAVYSDSGISR